MVDEFDEKLEREIRKVTEALKKLSETPAGLLFLEVEMDTEWDFDIPSEIQGLPVFFSGHLLNRAYPKNDEYKGIPWVPIWKICAHYDNIRDFNETYLDTE